MMSNRAIQQTRKEIKAKAIEWYSIIQSDLCTEEDITAFAGWIDSNLAHRRAYDELERSLSEFDAMASVPSIVNLRRETLGKYRHKKVTLNDMSHGIKAALSVAAVFLVMVVGSLGYFQYNTDEYDQGDYATAIGEQRSISLSDGTRLTLNTNSEVTVNYKKDVRHINLIRGEAYFDVASNPERPLTVYAVSGAVKAIGTAFNVRVVEGGGDMVQVTLMEGKVTVAQSEQSDDVITLDVGERVNYSLAGMSDVTKLDIEKILSWQRGQIAFDNTALEEALAEMNRYSARKVIIADERLKQIRISGVFKTGQVKPFLAALKKYYGQKYSGITQRIDNDGNILLFSGGIRKNIGDDDLRVSRFVERG